MADKLDYEKTSVLDSLYLGEPHEIFEICGAFSTSGYRAGDRHNPRAGGLVQILSGKVVSLPTGHCLLRVPVRA